MRLINSIQGSYLISNNRFISNKALGGSGGAIYISSRDNQLGAMPNYTIDNCEFNSNYADITGGAIYVESVPPDVRPTNAFNSNRIGRNRKSNNISSHPAKLRYAYNKNLA